MFPTKVLRYFMLFQQCINIFRKRQFFLFIPNPLVNFINWKKYYEDIFETSLYNFAL